jgi:predicted RND superfamily exporter protein
MEFDIKGYIIALLLGILSGLGLANVFNLDFSTAITTAGTFMAGIGAIGTVYIAYRALHSWKEKVAYDTFKLSVSNAAYFGESDRSFRFYPITFSSSFSSLPVLP